MVNLPRGRTFQGVEKVNAHGNPHALRLKDVRRRLFDPLIDGNSTTISID